MKRYLQSPSAERNAKILTYIFMVIVTEAASGDSEYSVYVGRWTECGPSGTDHARAVER